MQIFMSYSKKTPSCSEQIFMIFLTFMTLSGLSVKKRSKRELLLPGRGKGFIPSAQKCVVVRNHNSHKVLIMALY